MISEAAAPHEGRLEKARKALFNFLDAAAISAGKGSPKVAPRSSRLPSPQPMRQDPKQPGLTPRLAWATKM
jgi:hypothetical protein